MQDPFTIRPSSLPTWADCPRRWAARHLTVFIKDAGYKLQPTRPTHCGAAVGSGVHAGAAFTLDAKRLTGELGNATEAEDRAVMELRARASEGVVWDGMTGDIGTAQRQVARMTVAYRRYIAPAITPLMVEERLQADLGDGWTLSGQPDTLAGNPDEVLRDLKTGTTQRANGLQYGAYIVLLRAHHHEPKEIVEDFLPRAAIKKEQPPPISVPSPPMAVAQEAWEVIQEIKDRTDAFVVRQRGNRLPPHGAFRANPSSMLCGPKWCAAWGTKFCEVHKQEKTA